MGDELKSVKEKIDGISATGSDAIWQTIDLREKGLKPTKELLDPCRKDLTDPILPFLLKGNTSGVENGSVETLT